MTREEAIKYSQSKIEWAKQKCYPYISKEEVEIFETAIEALEQEQKTGHWILGICDNCGYDWGKDAPIASVPNFCPNCGARMAESEDKE